MSPIAALVAAAGLMDLAAYLFFYNCSQVAVHHHGWSAVGTLLLAAWYDVAYAAICLRTAGRSEGRSRTRFLLVGGALVVACGGAAALTSVVPVLVGTLAVLAFALGQWWPNLQARIGDLSPGADVLQRNLGRFNLGWSVGKGVGLSIAGCLAAGPWPFAWSAVVALGATGCAVVRAPRAGHAVAPAGVGDGRPAGFLVAGRLANFVWWGAGALVVWVMAARVSELEPGAVWGGWILAVMFLCQAGALAVLWQTRGWRYRRGPLLAWQGAGVVGLGILAAGTTPAVLALGAAACGVALGMAYYASIFYSLDAPAARGRTAAVHEAVLAAGGASVPLAGALAAWLAGTGAAAFALAAVVTLLALPVQLACLRAATAP